MNSCDYVLMNIFIFMLYRLLSKQKRILKKGPPKHAAKPILAKPCLAIREFDMASETKANVIYMPMNLA